MSNIEFSKIIADFRVRFNVKVNLDELGLYQKKFKTNLSDPSIKSTPFSPLLISMHSFLSKKKFHTFKNQRI